MTQTIGQVAQRVDLFIQQGADRSFDVVWKDPDGVPVDIDAVVSQVRPSVGSSDILLDIGELTTVASDGTTMLVRITAAETAALTPISKAVWSFMAVASSGEQKVLFQGECSIEAAVSVEHS